MSLKALCDAAIAGCLVGERGQKQQQRQQRAVLESMFQSPAPALEEAPAVQELRRAAQVFVREHAHLLDSGTVSNAASVKREKRPVCESILRDAEATEALKAEWRQILQRTYTVSAKDVVAKPFLGRVEAIDQKPQPNVMSFDSDDDDKNNHNNSNQNNTNGDDDDGDMVWEALQLNEKPSCGNAAEFIASCFREWEEARRIVEGERAKEFLRALHEVVDTGLDAVIIDGNWDFWEASLASCVAQDTASLEAVAVVDLLYARCAPRHKVLLIECISERIERAEEDVAGAKENYLQLLSRLLLHTPEDIVPFMDDEILHLLLCGMRVVVNHIDFFNTVDPQARWLKGLMVRPSVLRDIVLLPATEPEVVSKIARAMPAPHAVGLILTMLPLWVQQLHDSRTFTQLFDGIVEAVVKERISPEAVEDALACIGRCIRGITLERRYAHFRKVCDAITLSRHSEAKESVLRLLRLLLRFALPSAHESDVKYRLPATHLKSLEKGLLKKSENWSKTNAASQEMIGKFWRELLRWYAADLPKVVAHVVKTVCRHEKRPGMPWDEGHLVAVSQSIPLWRGLEEVLEDKQRASSLDYVALINHICADDMKSSDQLSRQESQRIGMWCMLMRWCTNAHARRGLFRATTKALRSLTKDNSITDNTLLAIPVEEFGTLFCMPQALTPGEMKRQRRLVVLLSIRLWIAALSSPVETPIPAQLDVIGMILQQLRASWVDFNASDMASREPLGEESLLILLCVYALSKLTRVGGSSPTYEHQLQSALQQLLSERRGFDPITQLLRYLTTGVDCDRLAPVLANRFEAACEPPIVSGVEKCERSLLLEVEDKGLGALERLLGKRTGKGEKRKENAGEKGEERNLRSVLLLLLQLHAGDASRAALVFNAYPTLKWGAYSRCTELAVGIVQHLLDSHPQVEDVLRCRGVDVYYLSLLCVCQWLRDPINSADLASASIEKFMLLGQAAWERIVAESLYTYVKARCEEVTETDGLASSRSESGVFPVSLFLALCLTKAFALVEGV
ncbi:hypothetical protein DQ04_01671030 [Trypanosoma grayi]|uniref:hypothetical protein n=1 Tax=Trypanosoma grayi TaxID=71804 RepID=UPI0004F4548E|nr:hypothetical protein DQ04_01671030 [Trypanosoma grayi]KEG12486.1 hypothetical protein DQ04_01671030 [Trypanosoma grayi]